MVTEVGKEEEEGARVVMVVRAVEAAVEVVTVEGSVEASAEEVVTVVDSKRCTSRRLACTEEQSTLGRFTREGGCMVTEVCISAGGAGWTLGYVHVGRCAQVTGRYPWAHC